MMKFILLYFLTFTFLYGNTVGIPKDTCALIVASRKTKIDVKAYIDDNISYTKYVTLYESNNGWYAIALGFLKDKESKSIMKKWKSIGKIPNDSFCTHGNKFKKEVFINEKVYSSSSKNYNASYSNHKSRTKPKNHSRVVKCLALTWGPDVCSQAFTEYVKKTDNTEDISDIIKSPTCATMIATSLGEKVSQGDMEIAIITGALDEAGAAGIESDSLFYNVLGGFAHLYSFGIKASVYDSCMNK